jgi:hypothetical protein
VSNDTLLFGLTDQVAVITLNRPEVRNAMNRELSAALGYTVPASPCRASAPLKVFTPIVAAPPIACPPHMLNHERRPSTLCSLSPKYQRSPYSRRGPGQHADGQEGCQGAGGLTCDQEEAWASDLSEQERGTKEPHRVCVGLFGRLTAALLALRLGL